MVKLVRAEIEPLGAQTVEVTRQPDLDHFGDPIPGTDETFEIDGCDVWFEGSGEESFRAAVTSDRATLLAPVYHTDLFSTDTVVWRGMKFRAVGNAMPWYYLDGDTSGVQLNLERSP